MKAKGRQLERLHKKTSLTIHKQLYKSHLVNYKNSMAQAKLHYYSSLIDNNKGNTKTLFSLLNKISHPLDFLPSHKYSTNMCNSLLSFFNNKITDIHHQLKHNPQDTPSHDFSFTPHRLFSRFHLPSLTDISDLVSSLKPSTCQLDPLPTIVVKSCLSSLLPLISAIIHSSLTSGIVLSLSKLPSLLP